MPSKLPPTPSHEEMERQLSDLLEPAFALGLANVGGPIDDQDRRQAEHFLKITETRDAFAAFMRQRAVSGVVEMAVADSFATSPTMRRAFGMGEIESPQDAMGATPAPTDEVHTGPVGVMAVFDSVMAQLREMKIPSTGADISDAMWHYVEGRRGYFQSILRGVLPYR